MLSRKDYFAVGGLLVAAFLGLGLLFVAARGAQAAFWGGVIEASILMAAFILTQ